MIRITTFAAQLTTSALRTIVASMLALAGGALGCVAQSIDSVVDSVVARSMALRTLAAEHDATLLERRADNALGGPSIEYSPFFENGKTGLGASELIVQQTFDFPTQYRQRREQLRLDGAALAEQYRAAVADVREEARLLCVDIIRTNQLVDMLGRRLTECDTILSLLQRRIDAGDATSLEVNKARLTRMAVQQQLAETCTERAGLLTRLQTLGGGTPIELDDRTFPACPLESDIDGFIAASLESNADLGAARATLGAQDHALAMSRRAWLPQLNVGYRRNTDGPARLNGFVVGAAFPLYSTSGRVKAARARQLALGLELDATRREAEDRLRSRWNELKRLQSVLDHSDTQLLDETLTLLRRAMQYGEITALDYYRETADIYDKLQAHIDMHCRYVRLYVEAHRDR